MEVKPTNEVVGWDSHEQLVENGGESKDHDTGCKGIPAPFDQRREDMSLHEEINRLVP